MRVALINLTRLTLLSTAAAVAILGVSAHPGWAAQAADSDGAVGLPEVIVTAQRREESLQRAAIAITAVPSDVLSRSGVSDVTGLSQVAPALQIGTIGGTNTQFYLRGVGNFTANSLSDAAISVNLDGVPLANSSSIQGMFYDLERVEVLKGPQGTLYGRNATGGAINVITAKPKLGGFSGYVNGEYADYNAVKAAAAVNVPIGETTAVRVAAEAAKRDGTFSDDTGDEDRHAFRVQVLTQPNDSFRLLAGGDYAHFGGNGGGQTLYGLNRDDRIGITDPRAGALRSTFVVGLSGNFLTPLPQVSFQDNTYWGVFAQADLDTPLGKLTVIPSYRDADVRYIAQAVSAINDRQQTRQFTLEARLASDADQRLSYLLGAFYLNESAKQQPGFTQDAFNSHANYDIDTKSYAAFGRLTYKVTDQFRVTGGLRYTSDDKSAVIGAYRITLVCVTPSRRCIGTPPLPRTFDVPPAFVTPNGAPIPVQPWGTAGAIARTTYALNNASKTFSKVTYRAGFEYDWAPQSLLYGSFETGFKAGGFFGTIDNPVFQPETIDAFTIGSKNRFFDNRLQLNLEAFWWTYKDQQVSRFRLNSLGQSEYVTENIGESRLRGFEVEAVARPLANTTLNLAVQYLDAVRTDYVYSSAAANGPPATGCPIALVGSSYRVNCNDTVAPNSPKWTVNAGVQQDFVLGNGGRISLNADGHYQSGYYSGIEELQAQRQDGYFTANLQAKYSAPDDHYFVAAFVNNVTDESAVVYTTPHFFAPTLLSEALIEPRIVGVRAGLNF
jgi:iron complex outermembrane receptor protein